LLTRKEKEERIIQLLKEGKNSKEIAAEVHVSFTTISLINKRVFGDESHPSLRTQAYRMFLEGNKPVNAAMTLDIPYDETKKLWNQYLELNKESVLLRIKNELQNDVTSFIKLYKEMKRNHSTIDEMWEGLETAQDIKAKSAFLKLLEKELSEAENKNNDLTQQIKEKIDTITRLNSEIFAIGKIKNSLIVQLRFAQEKMRNSFFTNNVSSQIPFQLR
jgi:hypothetical protein